MFIDFSIVISIQTQNMITDNAKHAQKPSTGKSK